ncbi:hybrid sensor histidine kinase/response regulator [Rhodobacter calidifons]|uniref:histidine kinase n=1 Tax=Rhodobacter calidifons TaxID=2715277 RepID=A0ABX0G9A4_9RHOB|nr:response regulator [Rhodobacter calidifons]NHB77885.1 response regulator [Rhodobacter calidifons]
MDLTERLVRERRARLAAERLLDQKSRELHAANEKLAIHARALSDQIVEQRQAVKSALTEAELLKHQNSRFVEDLDRAHTAAVMAERRLWDAINTIRDGFAVFDADMKLVLANDSCMAWFAGHPVAPGISYVEMAGIFARNMLDLGEETPESFTARMQARLETDRIEPVTLKLKTGNWIKVQERRGNDGGLVSLIIDITEQMRIWAAIDVLPDAFVLFDREERLLACNQRYREMFPDSAPIMQPGVTFEDLLRHGLKNAHVPEAVGREEEWLADRLAHFRAADTIAENRLANGRVILESDHVTPDGGRVGLRTDITAIREQQAQLEAARNAAEAANRAKSAFLANMSHEIRTPMNGVVGMAELLCDTALTEEQRLFAETIRSSGEALLVIINDILDYSKIEAERLTLRPEPFDLERTIHEVTMLLQPRAREKGIDLMIDFDMFLPTRYVADPGRLRQVLTNLIGNAVKFTEKGHVLTRVVGVEAEDGSQTLHVTVEDSGIGIAPDYLDHIFGEFNQVEDERNRKFEGTGLGLAITRRLIEHMGGAVWVDSEPGKGSSFGFRVTLPVAEDAGPVQVPVAVRRVIAVDDQFINRTILERQLAPCGIEVTLCRSGAEVMERLAADADYDVVLTDHAMPEMDGVQLLDSIRTAGHAMPVILLSSNPTGLGAHAHDFAAILQKPILRSDLYRHLQALTAPPAATEEPAPPAAAADRRQMRVLAAEDNRTNQLVFQKMVREMDIDLRFADNGRIAVEMYHDFRPDLVFMDISMPEMDGKEAARTLRASGAAVPIVALTAHAMDGDAAGILAAGIDRYLTKPLRKTAIEAALAEFCPPDARPPVATPVAPPAEDAA